MGWRQRLRKLYDSLSEFRSYSSMYGIHRRLGYKSAAAAWKADPMIEGSVIPSDLRRVGGKRKTKANRKRRTRRNRRRPVRRNRG